MKLIHARQFSGLMPRVNPEALPDGGAQVAQNVDLTSGKLSPINVVADGLVYDGTIPSGLETAAKTVRQHDGTNLLSEIPASEWFEIAKPSAPTVNNQWWIFQSSWLRARVYVFVRYIDSNGEFQTETWVRRTLHPHRVWYTDTGLKVSFYFAMSAEYTFTYGRDYQVFGPRFQFMVRRELLPAEVTPEDPVIPVQTTSFIDDETDETIGEFQAIDMDGPLFDKDIFVRSVPYIKDRLPACMYTATINLNYTIPATRYFYYRQASTNVDGDEGPPSDISEKIILKPGQRVKLNTVSQGRLYRSQTGGDDFLLLDDLTASTYVDRKLHPQPEVIPPYGNRPH
ncbi:MAG: hypothetical protein AB7E55_36560, partial [Pigmentiphaga sp.]